MAWNPSPEVAVARDAAKKLGAEVGLVIIYLNKDSLGMVSYGVNRPLCDKMKDLGHYLAEKTGEFYADEA